MLRYLCAITLLASTLAFQSGCQNGQKQTASDAGQVSQLIADGNFESALGVLNTSIGEDSKNAELLNLRGIVQLELGKVSKAIEDFSSAIESDSENLTIQVIKKRKG